MFDWIIPNLPQRPVKLVALTGKYLQLKHTFEQKGIDTILIFDHPILPKAISSHPDMLIHHLGNERILLALPGICEEEKLRSYGFKLLYSNTSLGQTYPRDCIFNVAWLKRFAFGFWEAVDCEIINNLDNKKVTRISVKQGYTKCNTCIVSENAIITSDRSIEKAAQHIGVDVLLIPPGEIILRGYPYGFFGGCTGLLGPNELVCFGDASSLTYYDDLCEFLYRYDVQLTILCKDIPPTDIGSIIPLY